MNHIFLEGKKMVELEDNRKMNLEYYLLEKQSTDNVGALLYGIKIVKKIDTYIESEEVEAISFSKEFVQPIIKKLMENEVTPISMIEIIDDLLTIELCS